MSASATVNKPPVTVEALKSRQHAACSSGDYAIVGSTLQRALNDDLIALINRMNEARDGTMVVPSEYLETIVTRR